MDYISYRSDNMLELRGPVNKATGLPVSNFPDSCKAMLFDSSKDTYTIDLVTQLSADEAASQTTLSVRDTTGFQDNDDVRVKLDDGTVHDTQINGTPTSTEITLDVGLASAASAGNEVRRYQQRNTSTYLRVNDTSGWSIDDLACVVSSSSTVAYSYAQVSQIIDDKFLVLDQVLDDTTQSGSSVSSVLNVEAGINMTFFGSFPLAVADTIEGDPSWGFRGTLPFTAFDTFTASLKGLRLGHRARIEYSLKVGSLNLLRTGYATVVQM